MSQVLANLYPGQRAAQNCCLSNMLWTLKKPCCQVLDEVNSATLFSHNHVDLWEIPYFLTQPRTPGSFVLLLPQLSSGPFLQRTTVLSLKCGLEAKLCALDVPMCPLLGVSQLPGFSVNRTREYMHSVFVNVCVCVYVYTYHLHILGTLNSYWYILF